MPKQPKTKLKHTILYGLGSIIAFTTPITAVISCGTSSNTKPASSDSKTTAPKKTTDQPKSSNTHTSSSKLPFTLHTGLKANGTSMTDEEIKAKGWVSIGGRGYISYIVSDSSGGSTPTKPINIYKLRGRYANIGSLTINEATQKLANYLNSLNDWKFSKRKGEYWISLVTSPSAPLYPFDGTYDNVDWKAKPNVRFFAW